MYPNNFIYIHEHWFQNLSGISSSRLELERECFDVGREGGGARLQKM